MVRVESFVKAIGSLKTAECTYAKNTEAGRTLDDAFQKKAKRIADIIIKAINKEKIDEIKEMPLSLTEKMYYVYSCFLGDFNEDMEKELQYDREQRLSLDLAKEKKDEKNSML